MELRLRSQEGKRLFVFLADWMEKSPGLLVDELKQCLLADSLKVENDVGFLASLHHQKVLKESPSVLSQQFPSTLSRVKHAMEIFLNKRRAKELVVALELSGNQCLLTEMLNWVENNSPEIHESIKGVSPIDLAPAKVQKTKEIPENAQTMSSVDLAQVKVQKPKETQESVQGDSSVNLAPVKVQKRKLLSEITSGLGTRDTKTP